MCMQWLKIWQLAEVDTETLRGYQDYGGHVKTPIISEQVWYIKYQNNPEGSTLKSCCANRN